MADNAGTAAIDLPPGRVTAMSTRPRAFSAKN